MRERVTPSYVSPGRDFRTNTFLVLYLQAISVLVETLLVNAITAAPAASRSFPFIHIHQSPLPAPSWRQPKYESLKGIFLVFVVVVVVFRITVSLSVCCLKKEKSPKICKLGHLYCFLKKERERGRERTNKPRKCFIQLGYIPPIAGVGVGWTGGGDVELQN